MGYTRASRGATFGVQMPNTNSSSSGKDISIALMPSRRKMLALLPVGLFGAWSSFRARLRGQRCSSSLAASRPVQERHCYSYVVLHYYDQEGRLVQTVHTDPSGTRCSEYAFFTESV